MHATRNSASRYLWRLPARGRRSPALIDSLGVDCTPFECIANPKCMRVQSISTSRAPSNVYSVAGNVYSYPVHSSAQLLRWFIHQRFLDGVIDLFAWILLYHPYYVTLCTRVHSLFRAYDAFPRGVSIWLVFLIVLVTCKLVDSGDYAKLIKLINSIVGAQCRYN